MNWRRLNNIYQEIFGRGVMLMMGKDPKGFHYKSSIILAKSLRKLVSQVGEKTFRVCFREHLGQAAGYVDCVVGGGYTVESLLQAVTQAVGLP